MTRLEAALAAVVVLALVSRSGQGAPPTAKEPAPVIPAVPNPGFEEVDETGKPLGWTIEPAVPEHKSQVSTRRAHRGIRSLHLVAPARKQGNYDAVCDRFPVAPGTRYTLTAFVHGSGNLFTHFYAADGKPLARTPYHAYNGRRWQKWTFDFTTPPTAHQLALRFRVYGPKGEAWIDDVSLRAEQRRRFRLSVPNPSLELLGADGKVRDWNMSPMQLVNRAEVTDADASHGRRSLHLMAANNGQPYCDATTSVFEVGGATTYTLSFDVKGSPGGRVFTHLSDADGSPTELVGVDWGSGLPFDAAPDRWTRVEIPFTSAPDARRMYLRFRTYPGGDIRIDGVQIDIGSAAPFDPGPTQGFRLALRRRTVLRGKRLPVSVSVWRGGAAYASSVDLTVEYQGRVVQMYTVKAEVGGKTATNLSFAVETQDLACGDYRLTATWRQKREVVAVAHDTFTVTPAPVPTIGFGFYGYRIEGCAGKRWPILPFTPKNIDPGLDLLASAHVNAFSATLRGPAESFTYFLDGAARRGIEVIPLLNLYFGRPAASSADYGLDAKGERVFVHTSPDRPNLSLLSEAARQQAAEITREQLTRIKDHPAFRGRVYFGDDVAMWRGKPDIYRGPLQDYSSRALARFKEKTGLDAPRPSAKQLRATKGVLPDDDPWLQWMRFRCADIMAGYQHCVQEAISQTVSGAVGGPQHGAVWWPGIGACPTDELRGVGLLTYYAYPVYPPYHLFHCALARLGGADKELWATPSAYNNIWGRDFETRTAAYERASFFSLLAGGATGITYCPFQSEAQFTGGHPAFWRELRRQGEIIQRFGPLLRRLRPAPQPVALLISFSTSAYRVFDIEPSPYAPEDTHVRSVAGAYFALLRAQEPVEIIDEEKVAAGGLARYKALVLVDVQVLPRSVVKAIETFAQRDGVVLTGPRCAAPLRGARRFESTLNAHPTASPETIVGAREAARRILTGVVPRVAETDSADLAVREFGDGGERAFWCVNLNTETWIRARLRIPGNTTAYAVLHGEPFRPGDELALPPGGGELILACNAPVEGLQADVPQVIVAGAAASMTFRVVGPKGLPLRGPQPVQVTLLDPEGVPHPEYGGYRATRNGRLDLPVQFALNDPAGSWTVHFRELLTGKSLARGFVLRAALTAQVFVAGGRVTRGRAEQAVDLVLRYPPNHRKSVEVSLRLPTGVHVGGPSRVTLAPGGQTRVRYTMSITDPWDAGPCSGALQVRDGKRQTLVLPLFVVFPAPQ